MKKVAREAGLSQGILHYYFTDKRAILVAALERVMADLHQRVAREAGSTRDAGRRLRALVAGCLTQATEAREFWLVFVEFWGQTLHDRRLADINAELYARIRRLVGGIVAHGIRAGRFRRVDPEEAGAVILALVDGLSLQLTFDPQRFELGATRRLGEDAVFRYLARGPRSRGSSRNPSG
jgi:AcrR family transcriptional regulator